MNSNDFWESLRVKAHKNYIPIHGHFELTPLCNLDCKMCYVHLNEDNINLLSIEEWKLIIDGAIENGMIFASLTGGECLTYFGFKELYSYLYSKGIMINILTNGVLLDRFIDFFVQKPPRLIQVSVYGSSESEYYNITGYKMHKKVSDNIESAMLHGLSISISVTPNKYLKSPMEIVKKYDLIGIKGGIADTLIIPREETGRGIDKLKLDFSESLELSKEINEYTNNDRDVSIEKNIHDISTSYKGLTCSAGRSDFTVNWKGEMMMCVSIYEAYGYPLVEGFANAWKKTSQASKEYVMPYECDSCKYIEFCSNCPANRNSKTDPGHCNKELCLLAKALYEESLS